MSKGLRTLLKIVVYMKKRQNNSKRMAKGVKTSLKTVVYVKNTQNIQFYQNG